MQKNEREIAVNVSRLNYFMDKNGLDAVAVRSGVNFTYLSGIALPGTLARHLDLANTVRGFMLIWPRESEPIIVLDSFAEKVVLRDSWVKRLELYQAYIESLYTKVAGVIEDLGLQTGRVGFEKDSLSHSHWEEVQSALPNLTMVDCSRMLDEVRWIKTETEIALQKRAADLLDDCLLEIFPTIAEGESERQVHARIIERCLRHGFGWVHGILNSSSNTIMYGGESDVQFRKGDFVRNDYVAYLHGTAGHQSRLAILGEPSEEKKSGYSLTLDVHLKTIEQCRPGVTAGELYAYAVSEFKKNGIDYTASLVGHGMGPWFHQQEPVLRKDSKIIIEKGMILAVEPQRQHWHLQDLILIEDNKPRLLSDRFPTAQPFVIG